MLLIKWNVSWDLNDSRDGAAVMPFGMVFHSFGPRTAKEASSRWTWRGLWSFSSLEVFCIRFQGKSSGTRPCRDNSDARRAHEIKRNFNRIYYVSEYLTRV